MTTQTRDELIHNTRRDIASSIVGERPSYSRMCDIIEAHLRRFALSIESDAAVKWLAKATEEAKRVSAQVLAGDVSIDEMAERR